jgi:hypothetical protein
MSTYEQILNDITSYNLEDIDLNILYLDILDKYNNKTLIDMAFYDLFEYEHTDEFIEETIQETTEERIKRKDTHFRDRVIEKYKRCIITNKPLKYCQVAHIYPYALSDETEKYDPYNALLLCSDFHIGFDHTDTDFIINANLKCIELSEFILSDLTMSEYHKYHNKKIELSDRNIYYLKKKYNL